MDLSIAFAFYFASRGTGIVRAGRGSKPLAYTTSARILLSGLGADELFAGYSRHGAAFARNGFPGLLESMNLDIRRLGGRNLGRDDRVIAHHGKQARYPYLDENFLSCALRLPAWVKTGFGQQDTVDETGEELYLDPEKRILRLLAWNLGMKGVSREKKRAVRIPALLEIQDITYRQADPIWS
jgi:asparagine synthetase B (glutamine-hydrolysing)